MHHSGWLQSVTRLSHVKGNDRFPVIESRVSRLPLIWPMKGPLRFILF
jgi:hypothetical protein